MQEISANFCGEVGVDFALGRDYIETGFGCGGEISQAELCELLFHHPNHKKK